ncbi:hypothetical protein EVA_09992 [gut metagenome]|uniref:DUF6965 domain-containing protein n=1 Tax=gut metagenome TaxID=749906 RepID=J9G4X5_9ZZZZ
MAKKLKQSYTLEEVHALKAWFDEQTLPESMQIDAGAFSPNLKETVGMLFEQAFICHDNPKMQGPLYLLEKIKAQLEK